MPWWLSSPIMFCWLVGWLVGYGESECFSDLQVSMVFNFLLHFYPYINRLEIVVMVRVYLTMVNAA